MKAVVLGSGPAGMFAAHALAEAEVDFDILSNTKERSKLQGAQYLHQSIPGITDPLPVSEIEYVKMGTAEGYSHRVYGCQRPDISWNNYPQGKVGGFNLRRAYFRAFSAYKDKINIPFAGQGLSYDDVDWITLSYDLVVNTVPLVAFKDPAVDYGFSSQTVWITSENLHYALDNRNRIIYNGQPKGDGYSKWYRSSQLFGWTAYEYGDLADAPDDAVLVRKPLAVAISPVPDTWLCAGRYGAWRKAALTHDAYYQTLQRLAVMS